MPIRFTCAKCGARVKTPDGSAGKRMKCPRCGHAQRVPEKSAAAETEQPTPPAEPAEAPPMVAQVPATPEAGDELAALAQAAASPEAASREGASAPETETGQAEGEDAAERGKVAASEQSTPQAAPPPGPTPQPDAASAPQAEGPKAIPLSSHRPRPTPQPSAGDSAAGSAANQSSALSASPLSGSGSTVAPSAHVDARSRSIDLSGELPRARTTREIRQNFAMLGVIAWFCRALAVLIAAGAVELMLHAKRQQASLVTQLILLLAGLAVAGLAIAVGQIAASVRKQFSR